MAFAGFFTDVNCCPRRGGFPIRHVLKNVSSQGLRSRIALRSSGNIQLAKKNPPPAFAMFDERAVLETVAAVDDREEIAASRFLDRDGSGVAAIAAAPKPGD